MSQHLADQEKLVRVISKAVPKGFTTLIQACAAMVHYGAAAGSDEAVAILKARLLSGRFSAFSWSPDEGVTLIPPAFWGTRESSRPFGDSTALVRADGSSLFERKIVILRSEDLRSLLADLMPPAPQDAQPEPSAEGEVEPKPVTPESPEEKPTKKSTRGRKPIWDWDGAVAYLISVANSPDGLPDVQADIERLVAGWFRQTVDNEPVESAIRTHVSAWCKGVLGKASNSPTSN